MRDRNRLGPKDPPDPRPPDPRPPDPRPPDPPPPDPSPLPPSPPPQPPRPDDVASAERFRGRFEAWQAQINQLLANLRPEWRDDEAVRHLVHRYARLRSRIARWSGGATRRRAFEREWSRLKRAWTRALDRVPTR